MIGVVLGTTGELIKLAPVLLALREQGQRTLLMSTGQQVEQLPEFLRDFGLPPVDLDLARGFRGGDLERKREVPVWVATVAATVARRRRELAVRLRSDGRRPVVLVHGDTMTTVLGALIGRLLGATVGHVEAGMRSGRLNDPFPEELNRRVAARLVDVHFAPGAGPADNLRRERVRGRIVDTGQNTIRDAVDLAAAVPREVAIAEGEFGLVSLHRFELIERPGLMGPLLELLHERSRTAPLLFVDHPVTAAAISAHGFERHFDGRFRRIPRLRYFPFIALLRASRFLVTDSGGSQEECAFLGHPCLVHRAVTEHATGLGRSVVLSGMDLDVVRAFLADPDRYRVPADGRSARPTEVILTELARMGAIRRPAPH